MATEGCPPGTTEDGIKRQKLMCAAIIKSRQDQCRNLVNTWLEVLDAERLSTVSEGYDCKQFEVAKTGLLRPTLKPQEDPFMRFR